MRIAIAGAGEVGTHLAKLLSRENMDICLLDGNAEHLGDLEANYDLMTRVGSPTSIHDIQSLGIKDVDLFIAVTPSESKNIVSCLIANQLGAKRTLARVDNYEYLLLDNRHLFDNMGLNHIIYPEVLAANEIEESLRTNWMRYHISLCQGALELCVVKVRDGAEIIGQRFDSGFYSHGRYRIVLIKRDNRTLFPTGEDAVQDGDMVYAICTKEEMEFLRTQFGKPTRDIRRVMFYGGTRMTQKAVQSIPGDIEVKILEADREKCLQLSEKVSNALIIHADGSSMDDLIDEGIQDMDAFVAVTDSSEANIFACLTAKRFGVIKTIADVENIDYIQMAERLDIGTVLNKKTITASYIYQMLLNASVLNVRNLTSADAEIVELVATEGSRITRSKIRDISLPGEVIIGGLVRAGEGLLVNGDTKIIPDDQVIVLCKSHNIQELERFFK
ncbi:MAG: Trk system potassium transporter TrkA [Paludibacteraceae bacterium]|nr:Trk system potassium transporter TrkA [Paludibacteraceae bacterium]